MFQKYVLFLVYFYKVGLCDLHDACVPVDLPYYLLNA
jgi:hypothetical protein